MGQFAILPSAEKRGVERKTWPRRRVNLSRPEHKGYSAGRRKGTLKKRNCSHRQQKTATASLRKRKQTERAPTPALRRKTKRSSPSVNRPGEFSSYLHGHRPIILLRKKRTAPNPLIIATKDEDRPTPIPNKKQPHLRGIEKSLPRLPEKKQE